MIKKTHKTKMMLTSIIVCTFILLLGALLPSKKGESKTELLQEEYETKYPKCENCTDSDAVDIRLAFNNRLIMSEPSNKIKIDFSVKGEDADKATLHLSSMNGNVIATEDLSINGDVIVVNKTLGEGVSKIKVTAKIDNKDVYQDYFNIEILDYKCNSKKPLDNIYSDGFSYFIGKRSKKETGNSLLAKKQLICISQNQTRAVLAGLYELTTNVEFFYTAEDEDWNGVNGADGFKTPGWEPLGNEKNRFLGNFNGKGHVIKHLYIDRPSHNHQGFIGAFDGDFIKNVKFIGADIEGETYVGAVVGHLHNAKIESVVVSGSVSGVEYVGGLVGMSESSITGSAFNGSVQGLSSIGGIVGSANMSSLYKSFSAGSVSGIERAGGLIGTLDIGSVFNNYSMANVSGSENIGGLIGYHNAEFGSSIKYSYASGLVSGNSSGALIGYNDGPVSIEKSYALNNDISVAYNLGADLTNYCSVVSDGDGCDPLSINSEWNSDFWAGTGAVQTPTLRNFTMTKVKK